MKKLNLKDIEVISMHKFLENYCGIYNETLLNKLCIRTHRELKELKEDFLPLITVSFGSVTEEELITGDIIYVLDRNNNVAPYKNPLRKSLDDLFEEDIFYKTKVYRRNIND